MKMLIISLIIMLSIIAGSALNCCKVERAVNELTKALEDIDDVNDTDAFDIFSNLWESHRVYFLFTVPMPRIDNADNAILGLKASIESGSHAEYTKGKILTERYIADIAQYSSFDLKNIL